MQVVDIAAFLLLYMHKLQIGGVRQGNLAQQAQLRARVLAALLTC